MGTKGADESLEDVVDELDADDQGVEKDAVEGSETDDTEEGGDDQDKKKPTVEELAAQVVSLTSALRKANRQAAERRIKLKELQKGTKTEDTSSDDKGKADVGSEALVKLAKAEARLKTYEREKAVGTQLDAMELNFASAQARTDLVGFVRSQLDDEFSDAEIQPDKDDIQDAIKAVIKVRPYLTGAKKPPPDTDSKKRGTNDNLVLDEKQLAANFGIKPM